MVEQVDRRVLQVASYACAQLVGVMDNRGSTLQAGTLQVGRQGTEGRTGIVLVEELVDPL